MRSDQRGPSLARYRPALCSVRREGPMRKVSFAVVTITSIILWACSSSPTAPVDKTKAAGTTAGKDGGVDKGPADKTPAGSGKTKTPGEEEPGTGSGACSAAKDPEACHQCCADKSSEGAEVSDE